MLKVDNINVSYGDAQVLYNVSIEVGKNEIVTVLGSNGAGKTSLLRAISGLIPLQSGNITFEGIKLEMLKPNDIVTHGLAMVPEGRLLFPEMSVKENLLLGAYRVKNKKEIMERFEFVISLFPRLNERKGQLAGSLSGGEQQMCAIGRALMSDPRFLMLDEPSLGLAPNLVEMIFEKIKDLNKKNNLTILLVEQNANVALALADYGYVIETGNILFKDTADKLLQSKDIQRAYLGL